MKIPAGVDTGTRIQLTGEGEVGSGNGPAGDLYVEVTERPHALFQRHGDDLHCTVTLPMTAAALGTTVTLETLDGPKDIDVRPGTQSGQVIPLYGLGVTHLRASGRGDLMVHVDVETPTKLDERQEQLLAELAKLRDEERPAGQFAPGQQGLFSRLSRRLQRPLTTASTAADERTGVLPRWRRPGCGGAAACSTGRRGGMRRTSVACGSARCSCVTDGAGQAAEPRCSRSDRGSLRAGGARPLVGARSRSRASSWSRRWPRGTAARPRSRR